jgi:hypothetical protein
MRFTEFGKLLEASGLRAATPGEVYADRDGTEYKFVEWEFNYPNDAEKFDSREDVENAVEEITRQNPNADIRWVNQLGAGKSFAFAKFQSDDSKEVWIGKYFQKVNPNNTIFDKDASAVNMTAAKGSAAVKAKVNMQPGQLGLADGKPRSVSNIVKEIQGHEQGNMLINAVKSATNNQEVIFQNGSQYKTAIQDDFCEVLAPIAIIEDHNLVSGSIDNAVNDIFKGGSLDGASIQFPEGQNNPLIDSFVTKDGIQMGISHKGKQGAKASVTNIWKAKEEAQRTQTGQTYIERYAEAVEILDICKNESSIDQPIVLATRYNLISDKQASDLEKLLANPKDSKFQLEGNPSNPQAVVRKGLATEQDLAKVPRSLRKIFLKGGYKPGSYVGYICLARIAYMVADYVNKSSEIDFGEAIRSFLNSSAMIQAKSIVTTSGDDAVLKSINVVYPPNFQEKATIEANSYYGTGIKSKFSFQLPST